MRTAVITGGNRGLGLATAAALADRGLRVVVASRGRRRAEEAARMVTAPRLLATKTNQALARDTGGRP